MKIYSTFKNLFYTYSTYVCYKFRFIRLGKGSIILSPLKITPKFISIGFNVHIQKFARLEGVGRYLKQYFEPIITIQDGVTIEQNLHLTCAHKIEIGKNTAIAANVTITDINHPYEDILLAPDRQPIQVGFVSIGEDCKIYNNVVILPNTTLGKHTVVGANSVVLGKQYPDFCILAGAPAKIIKRYHFENKAWQKTNDKGDFI